MRCIMSMSFRALLVALFGVAAVAVFRLYDSCAPHIVSVPVVKTNTETFVILGRGFGAGGEVAFLSPERLPAIAIPTTWTPTQIVVPRLFGFENASVQVCRRLVGLRWRSNVCPVVVQARDLPSQPYGYQLPVQADSPWPLFRRDHANSGHSPIEAKYNGDKPWTFHTGKGIFSTPVIGNDGKIYVGSADTYFYSINPDGTLDWKFKTGSIIDSAAAIHRPDVEGGASAVTFISGDGLMYHLSTANSITDPAKRVLWTFDAAREPGAGFINWWEGNVGLGFDGTLFAGNTNWNYYAINPDGSVKWKLPTGSNNWSMAAYAAGGTIFWASLDTKVRAVAPDGQEKWPKRTLGMVAASAAVGSDGTVYIGSFDSNFYALDPETGRTKWSFKTGNHIYSSAALGAGETGETKAIYFGSADGIFYALDPAGRLLWCYDTGDPIRSSPAVGRAPAGDGEIIYFGCGNGRLYALNDNGTRRWSYDTTPDNAELKDRNDLNGSPALGLTGIYIGGEHGDLCQVPYDYPLHVSDPRAKTEPFEDLPRDAIDLQYVTSGGTTLPVPPETIAPSSILTFRLVVRDYSKTVDARMRKDALHVEANPPVDFSVETSADGHYVHLRPEQFFKPDWACTIRISGDYFTGGTSVGNLRLGGKKAASFDCAFNFKVSGLGSSLFPMVVAGDANSTASAFEWSRLAVPLPTMMPSLNQIGFDSFDCIVSLVMKTEHDFTGAGKAIFWMVGAERDIHGALRAAPKPEFMIPLNGTYLGDQFILQNGRFDLTVQGVQLPFRTLELRGQMAPDLSVRPGATAYVEADALSIPSFGPLLVLAGLANDVYKKLIMVGTYVTRAYDGFANRCPEGVEVQSVNFISGSGKTAGRVEAYLRCQPGTTYKAAAHRPAIMLVDPERTEAVVMGYLENTTVAADARGNIERISLSVPSSVSLPGRLSAVVVLDSFPLFEKRLR